MFAALWIVFLAGLAMWTANPVTLNLTQLRTAHLNGAVIIAQVVNTRAGRLKVEEVLSAVDGLPAQIAAGQELTAESLADAGVRDGERAVLPVIVRPSGEVALAPVPTGGARAYPASAEVVAAVKRFIATP